MRHADDIIMTYPEPEIGSMWIVVDNVVPYINDPLGDANAADRSTKTLEIGNSVLILGSHRTRVDDDDGRYTTLKIFANGEILYAFAFWFMEGKVFKKVEDVKAWYYSSNHFVASY